MKIRLALLIGAATGQSVETITEKCTANQDCVDYYGTGACCLYFESDVSGKSYNCRSKTFVDYYINSDNYDKSTREWTDPQYPDMKSKVYCRMETQPAPIFLDKYPYPQPFKPKNFVDYRDPVNPNVRADMFYIPKRVENWDDQWAKWWEAWIWQFTPIPFLVFMVNLCTWTYDWTFNVFSEDPYLQGLYPSMYENDFTKSIMEDPDKFWGPFVYYDMFSWNGFWNYFWDQQGLNWVLWWELIKAFVRDGENDWTWGQSWTDDFIDKNRIFPEIIPVNVQDYNYWSSIDNGYDCNGRPGKGHYCYCPS